eukprot:TRINITY_DN2062_c0_g4_i1.p2 TRINITY_DN2062_c0_g4~~TRINITY_DN2062_c0_g4_i1.p2  ORF type:complete len:243 (+),score=15.98 TRINITY_DN2062_c0_g4_i1:78-806(+)
MQDSGHFSSELTIEEQITRLRCLGVLESTVAAGRTESQTSFDFGITHGSVRQIVSDFKKYGRVGPRRHRKPSSIKTKLNLMLCSSSLLDSTTGVTEPLQIPQVLLPINTLCGLNQAKRQQDSIRGKKKNSNKMSSESNIYATSNRRRPRIMTSGDSLAAMIALNAVRNTEPQFLFTEFGESLFRLPPVESVIPEGGQNFLNEEKATVQRKVPAYNNGLVIKWQFLFMSQNTIASLQIMHWWK